MKKFGSTDVWHLCTDLFDLLPIAAVIDQQVLCIHGGLSPDLKTIDEINKLERKVELPESGPLCDLMWSDPDDDDTSNWKESPRGVGFWFGQKQVAEFCHTNSLKLIARSH